LGFRVRIPLGKNVRLNVSRKSVGISAGTKGVRASVSSRGYINTSVSYSHTHKVGKKNKNKSLFELIIELFKRK